ncbi:hypothetical protein AGMMS50212_00890 [Spirochaetia bacterium]|nr:hypothetical protein AGMMS50212_00890 [Spirochaetia bacterium]
MATEEIFDKLRDLQDVLARKIELEREISEIPKMLTTQEELLLRLKKAWIDKDQEYVKVKLSEGECRNLLFEAESTREKAEKHMDVISTQREYENLDKEIKDASEKEQQYRKDLQQIEHNLNELNNQMQQSKELMDQQEAELQQRRRTVESDVANRKHQLMELETKEKELTQGMDSELLFKFERIIKKKGGRGIVAIKNGVCTCCNMILPAQFANDVRAGKDIVSCPYCSSILSYEESDDGEENYFDNDTAGSLSDLDDLDDDEFDDDEDDSEDDKINMDYEE